MSVDLAREPFSIKCLRAIEGLVGGREALAKRLNISKATISVWIKNQEISKNGVIGLINLTEVKGKFSAEELLGKRKK